MCNNPQTLEDGTVIACRRCTDCLNARKNNWIARAMAEKATSKETFSITLTYGNDTENQRDGAKVFQYRDIKNFMKNLRRQIKYYYGVDGAVRYIVAGELGGKRSRCHWHIVIFCNVDILALGKWSHYYTGKPVNTRAEKISVGKRRKRLHWSLWKQGIITVQEPDQGGITYAIGYVLKDQFGIEASKGTEREDDATGTAAGMFRMSKKPPIGAVYLDGKLKEWLRRGVVPVKLQIPVPNYSGFWYPTGAMRERLIRGIYAINALIIARTGRRAPQMQSLLASVVDQEKDWEGLVNGEEEAQIEELAEEFGEEIRQRAVHAAEKNAAYLTRQRCGGPLPCQSCLRGQTEDDFARIVAQVEADAKQAGCGLDAYERRYREENPRKINPHCALAACESRRRAFHPFS